MTRYSLGSTRTLWRALWACWLLLVIGLAVRLFWRASQMETGLETLSTNWRDATIGWAVGDYQPIASREPQEQAEYWLAEVDRVLEAHPDDAQLMMGAAIVLDSPGRGFVVRYVKRLQVLAAAGTFPEFDDEGIKRAEDAFEDRCRHRCLELAAAAARSAPGDLLLWRLVALLQERRSMRSPSAPRHSDWLDALEECARHDPDNALYDYMAASYYWRAAAKVDYSASERSLVIKDGDKFQLGTARFERGQTKPQFVVGDAGITAVTAFLLHTRTPLTDQEQIVNSRDIPVRQSALLHDLWQWQDLRAKQQAAGNLAAALRLSRQNLRLIAQYQTAGTSTAHNAIAAWHKAATAAQIREFANAAQGEQGDSQRQQAAVRYEAAIVDREILRCAEQNLASNNPPSTGVSSAAGFVASLLLSIAPPLVVLLLLFGLLAAILSRRWADDETPRVGPIGQAATSALAIVVTAVLFGLAPAEIVSRPAQSWFFTVALLAMPIVLACWIAWHWLRRRAFQFSIRAMLMLTFLVAVFFSLAAVFRPREGAFSSVPFSLSMPTPNYQRVDVSFYVPTIAASYGHWPCAFFVWTAYRGPYLTLVLWAGLLAAVHRGKLRRARSEPSRPLPDPRQRLGEFLRSLGRPALKVAAMLLVMYLLLAPSVLEQAEQEFQTKMAFARDPQAYWATVEAAAQEVRSDAATMSQLKAAAKAEANAAETTQ